MSVYLPYYPTWEDEPDTDTPITAAALNNMEAGIVAASQGGVDYKGAWAAGTAYKKGDVVVHDGVEYVAVNPSTGQEPPPTLTQTPPPVDTAIPIGTALPSSPADGDEFVLVDSLTAPTYSWRFRYVASITDAYKWVFIGGSLHSLPYDAAEYSTAAAYQGPYGPAPTLPRAGIYDFEHVSVMRSSGAGEHKFRFKTTSGAITGIEHPQDTQSGNSRWLVGMSERITVPTAGLSMGVEIYSAPGGFTSQRHNTAIPVRLA